MLGTPGRATLTLLIRRRLVVGSASLNAASVLLYDIVEVPICNYQPLALLLRRKLVMNRYINCLRVAGENINAVITPRNVLP